MIPRLALFTVAQIRTIEQAALKNLPHGSLMQRAGQAAAEAALKLLSLPYTSSKVLVLAGPGNNGGDALEAACRLAAAGVQVLIIPCYAPEKLPADAQQALQRARAASLHFADSAKFGDAQLTSGCALVIDGLFGIGLARPIEEPMRHLVEEINRLGCPVLALDVPSGLNADTGKVVGDGVAIRASETITFLGDKPGLHTCDGRDYAGKVTVATLGIGSDAFPPSHASLNDVNLFSWALNPRLQNSHKGSYGDVAVIGGAPGMVGAPVLASRAAAQCGAGRVFAAFVGDPPAYDSAHPELMFRHANEINMASSTLVVGPGLGISDAARELVAQALMTSKLVLDADALNLIAAAPDLARNLAQRATPAVLTPHPLEAARLLNTTAGVIQNDRTSVARELAKRFNAIVILKGSGTIIARPSGDIVINTTGNPALATAGSGDVLAGICGALLAQHWPAWEAALGAVWLHGHAADALVEQGIGPIGLTASELIPAVRIALNRLIKTGRVHPRKASV